MGHASVLCANEYVPISSYIFELSKLIASFSGTLCCIWHRSRQQNQFTLSGIIFISIPGTLWRKAYIYTVRVRYLDAHVIYANLFVSSCGALILRKECSNSFKIRLSISKFHRNFKQLVYSAILGRYATCCIEHTVCRKRKSIRIGRNWAKNSDWYCHFTSKISECSQMFNVHCTNKGEDHFAFGT